MPVTKTASRSIIFTGRPASDDGWLRAAGWTLGSMCVALALAPGLVRSYPRFASDGHMRTSFNQAVDSVFCGTLRLSPHFDIPAELNARPDQLFVPIAAVIDSVAGSVERYCRSLTLPIVNNENSLMLAMQGIVRVNPRISAAGLGRTLSALRLLIVAALCFALFRSGASLLTGLIVTVLACCVLRMLAPYQYGASPFIFALPLLAAAVYVLLLKMRPDTTPGVITAFAGVGVMVAFWLNMRTSQAPISLAMFAAFAGAWRRSPRPDHQTVAPRRVVLALVVFVTTVAAAHLALVRSVAQSDAAGLSHHLIAHPLVLALADPPNPLSQREGIQWDDANGLALARRLNPRVEYLSADYDRTLGRYYIELWKAHPSEMLGVYVAKIAQAGSGVLEQAAIALEHRWMPSRVNVWLGRQTVSGVTLIALASVTMIGGWWLFQRTASLVAFAWVLLSISAFGTLLESALIVSRFFVFYHGVLLLYVLTLPLAFGQLALDGFRWRMASRMNA